MTSQADRLIVAADGSGEFRSIAEAARSARSGDEIVVRDGVYREEVRVGSPTAEALHDVVLRSERPYGAIIKGSEVWTNGWRRLEGVADCWQGTIDKTVFRSETDNPYLRAMSIGERDAKARARPCPAGDEATWLPKTLGQLFVDGFALSEVGSLLALRLSPGTWMVSPDGERVLIHPRQEMLPLQERMVEYSVRNRVLGAARRGCKNIVVSGFVLEHCANQGPFPQVGLCDIRSGSGWVIENCMVRHAKTIGITIGAETWEHDTLADVPSADRRFVGAARNVVRNCRVSDCGLCGIAGWGAWGCCLYGNVVERNGGDLHDWPEPYWEEAAGIKLHLSSSVIAGNVVRDNESYGVWLDTQFENSRVCGNLIVGNKGAGVMLETAFAHALVDNNVIGFTRPAATDFYPGDGVYSHNGSGVAVVHNLLARNAGVGVRFRTLWSKIGKRPTETSDNRILNNLFFANNSGQLTLSATNEFSHGTVSDGNAYVLPLYPSDARPFPFRFAGYNIGSVTWKDLHAQTCAGDGRTTGGCSFELWRDLGQPLCAEDWRRTTGFDMSSKVVRGGRMAFSMRDMTMALSLPKEIAEMKVRPVRGLVRDFFGRTYGEQGKPVCPGPFQGCFAGTNVLRRAVVPANWQEAPPLMKWNRDFPELFTSAKKALK